MRIRIEWILMVVIIGGMLVALLCPFGFIASSKTLSLLHSTLRELIRGNLMGTYQGHPNHADFRLLEPGDIIMTHNQNGGYGYWTHAAIYVGKGQVVESSNFILGTHLSPIDNFHYYDAVGILRVNASADVRKSVAQTACLEIDKPYDIFSALYDSSSEYCSKLVWQVFFKKGINLCQSSPWILPDDIASSKKIKWLGIWNT